MRPLYFAIFRILPTIFAHYISTIAHYNFFYAHYIRPLYFGYCPLYLPTIIAHKFEGNSPMAPIGCHNSTANVSNFVVVGTVVVIVWAIVGGTHHTERCGAIPYNPVNLHSIYPSGHACQICRDAADFSWWLLHQHIFDRDLRMACEYVTPASKFHITSRRTASRKNANPQLMLKQSQMNGNDKFNEKMPIASRAVREQWTSNGFSRSPIGFPHMMPVKLNI